MTLFFSIPGAVRKSLRNDVDDMGEETAWYLRKWDSKIYLLVLILSKTCKKKLLRWVYNIIRMLAFISCRLHIKDNHSKSTNLIWNLFFKKYACLSSCFFKIYINSGKATVPNIFSRLPKKNKLVLHFLCFLFCFKLYQIINITSLISFLFMKT